MTAPTPGPWSVELTIAGDTILTSGSETLAFLVGKPEQVQANAQVMAASPDLLAALIKTCDGFERCIVRGGSDPEFAAIAVSAARAAIQKASAP